MLSATFGLAFLASFHNTFVNCMFVSRSFVVTFDLDPVTNITLPNCQISMQKMVFCANFTSIVSNIVKLLLMSLHAKFVTCLINGRATVWKITFQKWVSIQRFEILYPRFVPIMSSLTQKAKIFSTFKTKICAFLAFSCIVTQNSSLMMIKV